MLANFSPNFSKNMLKYKLLAVIKEESVQKSQKEQDSSLQQQQKKKPDKYRKNHKNNKVSKSSDLKKKEKEKGKEGPIEVSDFCEIYGLLKAFFFLLFLLFFRYLLRSLFR